MSEPPISPQHNPFRHAGFRRLFAAQAIALAGTGLSTVGLQLLAYRLTGGQAAPVLATALSIKMIAYVFLAPVCGGLAHRTSRKSILVASDVLRAGLVLLLPFAAAEWHIYLLIFAIQALAAASKPVLQAIIPAVLPDQATYTRALSWTRLAYDMETVGSMMLAIALMAAGGGFELLFELNAAAFLLSALLIVFTRLPKAAPAERAGRMLDDVTFGLRSYMATPRLRALLALHFAAAMVSGAVLVNNVDYVRAVLGGGDYLVAATMLAYGAGSMAAALATPLILRRIDSRRLVSRGALLAGFAALFLILSPGLAPVLAMWMAMGAGGGLGLYALGKDHQPVLQPGRPASVFLGALLPFPFSVAGELPAGGMAGTRAGAARGRPGPGADLHRAGAGGRAPVAAPGARRDPPTSMRRWSTPTSTSTTAIISMHTRAARPRSRTATRTATRRRGIRTAT